MSLHGVKRTRQAARDSEAEAAEKREKEQRRIAEYQGLCSELYALRARGDYASLKANTLTASVLTFNPEHPTAWSVRRRHLIATSADDATLRDDLDLTQRGLKRNPKVYPIWEHRKWVMRRLASPDWKLELRTVEMMLERDPRNFHAWDYRRYLISHLASLPPSPSLPLPTPAAELAYTKSHISRNFSNFSAWHYRSKILTKIWASDASEKAANIGDELELVKQAMYVDPADQSAWIYHRWLLSQTTDCAVYRAEIAAIEELVDLEPDSRWALSALVAYETRLRQLDPVAADEATAQRSRDRLMKLAQIDPLRRDRYGDLLRGAVQA